MNNIVNPRGMETTVMTDYKTCVKCGKILPASAFRPNNKSKDGLQSYCKECQAEYDKERREAKKALAEEAKKELERMASNADTIKLKDGTVLRKVVKEEGNPLAKFTARELLAEIKRRGYKWEKMTIVQEVDFNKI